MKYFKQVDCSTIASLGYTVTQYQHETGATLVHIKADTPERAFCAAFRTVPTDSTGVFHILEHSCLSGSESYPIGSPILYMMKHSMQTYLNALTFQGKTLYPCASCHSGDFENLMKVYLDAVFHPLLTRQTFQREGWHLEQEDIQGVVYNEMQGALSSLDSRIYQAMKGDLYPNTYQRHCSGGDPKNIPELTYEEYLRLHHQHYSAKNCVLCLRGDFQPEEYEALLHQVLLTASDGDGGRDYDRQEAVSGTYFHEYPVSEAEDTAGRTALVYSYNVGDYEQGQRLFALSLLAEYLMENQNSPLKKALLETGLLKDTRYLFSQERQAGFGLVMYNTDGEHRQRIGQVIEDTIRAVIAQGVDKQALRATLSAMDFSTKESALQVRGRALEDFANVCNNLFYGLPLTQGMDPEKLIRNLEEALDTDYYEDLLREVFLENPITACSVLVPKPQSSDAAHKENVKVLLARLDEEQRAAVTAQGVGAQPDRPEDLAKMPSLSQDDLNVQLRIRPFQTQGRLLYTQAETAGIVYLRYYFSLDGMDREQLLTAKLLSRALTQLSTEKYTVEQLSKHIKTNMGQLDFYPTAISAAWDDASPYFMVTVACLEKKLPQAKTLLEEILCNTSFRTEEMGYVLTSEYDGLRRSFAQNGMSIAQNRCGAGVFPASRYFDLFGGYEYLEYVKQCIQDPAAFCRKAQDLAKQLFCDVNLHYLGVTATQLPENLLLNLPVGKKNAAVSIALADGNTAYAVASGVSYNAASVRYDDILPFGGKHLVMAKLISLGYLWHQVREVGGAYGTFLNFARNGRLLASSYRDPQVGDTAQVFRNIARYLRSHDWTEQELLGGMIGAVAEQINPKTPAVDGVENEIAYLTNYTVQQRQQVLRQACDFCREDIDSFIPVFERMARQMDLCSVGNGEKQRSYGKFSEIISVS